jgi:hypothetical protein
MLKLGKYFVEVDTSVTKGEAVGFHFQREEDRDVRVEQLVEEFGIEVINAIGDYNA